MRLKLNAKILFFLFAMFFMVSSAYTQTTISGKVMDEENTPLIGANVSLLGTTEGTSTDVDGNFSITTNQSLPVTIEISYIGYITKEMEVADESPLSIILGEGILTEEVVISASRKREKIQEAPASITVLTARKLEGSPQADPVRNLINVPGVQIQQQSASRINIEMRASSGLFGTSVFPIKDYRSLIGPGIGTFSTDNVGLSTIDLERIEVVRGPGSALYGPGVTSGVIHFITKNPIDHPGTTLQIGGGELSTFLSAVRHAGRNENKTFGYKINAYYNRGDEFSLDGSEGTTNASGDFIRQIDKFQTQIIQPAITSGVVDLTKPGEVLLTRSELDPDGDGNMMQNDWKNAAIDGTLEFRPTSDLSLTIAGGFNTASSVFYNDLGEGLSQSQEFWTQARVQKGGLFAQFFYVDNDGGDKDNPTLLYQSGNRSPVGRKQVEGQVQYNIETPNFLNADWTLGIDYRQAISETFNLVYGRNEDDDDYRIFGGYLQGKFAILDQLDLLLAGRYDSFNILDEGFFSPRIALVIKPDPKHTFRATFNRAGAPPTGLQYNIDFPVNAPAPGVFDFWLAGMRDLHTFNNPQIEFLNQNVVAAGIAAAIDPTGANPTLLPLLQQLAAGLPDQLPAGLLGTGGVPGSLIHGAATQAVIGQVAGSQIEQPVTDYLASVMPPGSLGLFFGINAFEGNSPLNELIPTNNPTISINNTIEFGYKGLIKDKLGVSIDLYRIGRSGFSDFTQIAPLITLVNQDLAEFNRIAADFGAFLINIGVDPATAQGLATLYGTVATAVPNFYGTGTVESNRMPQGDGILHVPAGYRIFPDANLNFWGLDLALEYFFTPDLSGWFNYSWVSKTSFQGEELGEEVNSPLSFFLNSPKNKYRLGVIYAPISGFRGNISFQHDDSFFANVGDYTGDTDTKNLVDIGVGYSLTNGLSFDLTATNVLDNEYRAFVNMPKIGRRVLGKVTYTFGKKDR